jgi:uncharacterized damage-inducible protein DinB
MRVGDLETLYDYYYWATQKILAQAKQVTPEQWAGPPPVGDRSLRETLVHMLDAERGWRQSWVGGTDFTPVDPVDYPDAASLAARWREEEVAMRAYLRSLSDDDLQGAFYDYDAPDLALTLWQVIAHVSYHGMQHRSEAAMLLTHFGHSPGGIDMVFWLFERASLARSRPAEERDVASERT